MRTFNSIRDLHGANVGYVGAGYTVSFNSIRDLQRSFSRAWEGSSLSSFNSIRDLHEYPYIFSQKIFEDFQFYKRSSICPRCGWLARFVRAFNSIRDLHEKRVATS